MITTIIILLLILMIIFNKRGVPVFLYHQVNNLSNVSPELFEEHLKIIKKLNMKSLTMTEYYNKKAEKNSILITFDDGYFDNYKYVFPLLKKYGIKATIFLNTLYIPDIREKEPEIKLNYDANFEAIKNFLEKRNGTSEQYMSWQEIKEMNKSGLIDFQAHSHKHTAIFTDKKILGFTQREKMDYTDIYLYGKAEDNYPIFHKRGEYSTKGFIIKKEFFDIFKKFYEENIKNKVSDNKEQIIECQKFIDKNLNYFHKENEEEYRKRIEEEFKQNRALIEKNLKNKVLFFCWPWGHRSKNAVKILEKIGVKAFISTKKGTNSLKPNWQMIKRIELRNYTRRKFKLNVLIARNYLLGKVYSWIS